MGKNHLPEMIFVVVLLFSYDSITLENIYVFNHIFRLFIGIKKARAPVSCIRALLAIYTDVRAYRPSASLLAFLAGRVQTVTQS